MKITSRFSIAVHTLLLIYFFQRSRNVTSNFIASSVNTNPVVIRRILSNLKEAGLIEVLPGRNGSKLIKNPNKISLLDIFKAVDSIDTLFNFHDNPNPECPVGKNIHTALDGHLIDAQKALEDSLAKTTLEDLIKEINQKENLL